MAYSDEYIRGIFNAAKNHLPKWVWNHLHKIAFPSSGGHARHRKEDDDVGKQAAPTSASGLTVDGIVTQLSIRGEQYSKAESNYVEPTTDLTACGACRFYLRDPHNERGLCQVVTGPIAWFGACDFYIAAIDEAMHALEGIIAKQGFEIQTIVFPKDKWTLRRARRWLADHDFTQEKLDETENAYRFRQLPPGQFARIRPLCLMPQGAMYPTWRIVVCWRSVGRLRRKQRVSRRMKLTTKLTRPWGTVASVGGSASDRCTRPISLRKFRS